MIFLAWVVVAAVTAVTPASTSAHLAVTTTNPQAQAAFDRGLFLYYAYNRQAAERAFQSAAAADANLAMAYWGEALADGPDLNTAITPAEFIRAQQANERAAALAGAASPAERALIAAQARRYRGSFDDFAANDAAYRMSMLQDAKTSTDETVQNLAAEALLEHNDTTGTARALVAGVLARDPSSPMANHLCIHLEDEAADRSAALPCAQRLDAASFAPAAEHLAHMPAHYWIETGDYAKAASSSARAVALLSQLEAGGNDGDHVNQYAKHDVSVGYSAAMMLGNYAAAAVWAKRMNHAFGYRFDALTALRFARYEAASAAQPDEMAAAAVRGYAALLLGQADRAQAIGVEVRRDTNPSSNDGYLPQLFLGRLAEALGHDDEARRWLEKARDNQRAAFGAESIPLLPAGEALGGFYYRRGQYAQSADAFGQTLALYPNDPRALYGLALALERQGRAGEAERARQRFQTIWAGADTVLTPGDL